MKSLKSLFFFLLLILGSLKTYSQSDLTQGIQACNEMLNADIRTKYATYDQTAAKAWLYEYFSSSATKRAQMKSNQSAQFGFKAFVDAIPIGGSGNASSDKASSIFTKVEQESLKQAYVSDENLSLLITSFLPKEVFTSYDKCLELVGNVVTNNTGVKISIPSQTEEIIVLKLEFHSVPFGKSISIGNADYTNADALGGKKFVRGKRINDGDVIFEQIKRQPGKDVTITINFNGGSGVTKTISSEEKISKETSIPIGSIVASLLPYNAFMDVNKYQKTTNLKVVTWVACDGRSIATSKYSGNGGGIFAPDLRGVFLRGINNYNEAGSGVTKPEQLNPDNKIAGEFQNDALKKHVHQQIWGQNNGTAGTDAYGNNLNMFRKSEMPQSTAVNSDGEAETRPKNITVYYYLKIN